MLIGFVTLVELVELVELIGLDWFVTLDILGGLVS